MSELITDRIGVDLFSGIGGLSIGAGKAGIGVKFAIEKDKYAAETYIANHQFAEMICDDITNVRTSELVFKPFILFGGPPCQGFSISNRKTRNLENKNNSLFIEFLRFARDLEPDWFLFENVEGIVTFNNGDTLSEIIKSFNLLGYKTIHKVLYASDYGVPQHRNRFFLVGNKKNISFEFPPQLTAMISVDDAIRDLPMLENGANHEKMEYRDDVSPSEYASSLRKGSGNALQNYVSKNADYVIERYKHIKPGGNWSSVPKHLMSNYSDTKNCHSGIYKRLDPNKPSVVISNYRKNMLIHPYENRGLSVREAARLQSFPDTFVFKGTINHIQQQIGNAVPPLLAEAIFKQIIKHSTQ